MAVILGLLSMFAWFLLSLFFVAVVTAVLWDHYFALEGMKERVAELEQRLAETNTSTP
jgi:hypothetical protein